MGRDASNLPTEQWTPHYKVFLSDGITPCLPACLPLVRALHGESVQMELMVERPGPGNGICLEVTARPLKADLGYNLGVNSYIQKPVDFDQFRATVKSLGLYWLVVNRSPGTDHTPE
jgi:hypothetical protein